MPERKHSLSAEMALDRYWDALLAGSSVPSDDSLDPDLTATVQRVHGLDGTPQPHPVFAATLWEDLMSAHAPSSTIPTRAPLPLQSGQSVVVRRPFPYAHPQQISRVAAAIVLILLLVGSAFAALFPHMQREGEGLPLFALVATPTAESESAPGTVLVDLTLTDIQGFPNEGGMAVTDYPPGGSSVELAGKESPEVFYIATGPMTMRVEEAVDPVRVISPREAGSPLTERFLAAGEEMTLATGTAVVSPEQAIVELRNDEAVPTRMLDLLWATESYSTESGGAQWSRGTGMNFQDLVFPVSIVLRQLTLAPEGVIPAPESVDTVQAAAPLEPSQRFDLLYRSDDSILNTGTEPVDLYHLTITNNAETVTPGRSIATPDEAGELEVLWRSTGGTEPRARLAEPYGVGIDPEGNIWVSNGSYNRFQIIAPDGAFRDTWGTAGSGDGEFSFYSNGSQFARGYGDVAFDGEGNIYVADTGNTRVQKFAPDRTFLVSWGSEGNGDGQFQAPSSIAIGTDGVVYVGDETRADVQLFSPDGHHIGTIAGTGQDGGEFSTPGGLTVDPAGDLWVADWGSLKIHYFTAAGEWLDTWGHSGSGEGALRNPNDVVVDEQGHVIVVSDFATKIDAFTTDGRFLATVGGFGNDPGQLTDPLGLALGSDGVVYVSDVHGVQAFRLALP